MPYPMTRLCVRVGGKSSTLILLLYASCIDCSSYLKTRLSLIGSSLQVIEKMERESGLEPATSSLGKLAFSHLRLFFAFSLRLCVFACEVPDIEILPAQRRKDAKNPQRRAAFLDQAPPSPDVHNSNFYIPTPAEDFHTDVVLVADQR
jgi:hypothetical protein